MLKWKRVHTQTDDWESTEYLLSINGKTYGWIDVKEDYYRALLYTDQKSLEILATSDLEEAKTKLLEEIRKKLLAERNEFRQKVNEREKALYEVDIEIDKRNP